MPKLHRVNDTVELKYEVSIFQRLFCLQNKETDPQNSWHWSKLIGPKIHGLNIFVQMFKEVTRKEDV